MLLEKKINTKSSVLDNIKHKQLNWYDHVQRMNEERLPRRKGRTRNSRMEEVTTEMR